jgi:putative FmdB family regulatory protein
MPIYEYRCNSCGRRSQLFFRSFGAADGAACPHCQSPDLTRLPSRVAQVRSEAGYRDFLSDPSNFTDVDYENPRSVAEWAKKMGEATGEDLGPEYDEMVEQMARGEDFDDAGGVPDLGGADDDW